MTIIVSTTTASPSTAQQIINRAARLLGQIGPNTDLGADESADALMAVNNLIDSWRNEKLMCFANQEETVSLVAAQASYTIGPNGDLDTTRPVRIDSAYILSGTESFTNIRVIEDDEYDAIPDKTSSSTWPNKINYRPSMPLGVLYVHPVPSGASSLVILTWTPIYTMSLADTLALPPGWEEALSSNLALRLAPEYDTEPSPAVAQMAREAKANIKRINARPLKAYTELPMLVGRGRRTNIITGV